MFQPGAKGRETYQDLVDRLVASTKGGHVISARVKKGVWNPNATQDFLPEQYERNQVLISLESTTRDIVARIVDDAFLDGVLVTLRLLEELGLIPHEVIVDSVDFDFFARLEGSEWPADTTDE